MKILFSLMLISYSWCIVEGSEMIDKSLEAGYKQSGMEENVNKLLRYGKNKAEVLGVSKELEVVGYGYNAIRSKSLKIPIGTTIISVYRNSLVITIGF